MKYIYLWDDEVALKRILVYGLCWYRLPLTVVKLTRNVTYILKNVQDNKGYEHNGINRSQLCLEILTVNVFFFRIYKNDARLILLLLHILLGTWNVEFWRKIQIIIFSNEGKIHWYKQLLGEFFFKNKARLKVVVKSY